MKKNVIITTDSASDLPGALAERYGIKVMPLTVVVGNESHLDGIDFNCADMHESYKATGIIPKTSAPSLQSIIDFFKPFIDDGYEVVYVSVGGTLSSTLRNVQIISQELGGGIYTVDTKNLSNGVAMLAIEAAEYRDRGMSAREIVQSVSPLADRLNISFVLDTLEFIWKGGRCSGITAMGANMLRLKPALEMKNEKLTVYKKYRGNIKSVYLQYIKERLRDEKIYKNRIFLITPAELDGETEKAVRDAIASVDAEAEIERTYTGCSIFSHCGPGALGIMFISE